MEIKGLNRKPSRREFIRAMALGGAGVVATACRAQAAPQVVDKIMPVVVKREVEKTVEKEVAVTPTSAPEQTHSGGHPEMLTRRRQG